jgi:hypothetical protein
MEFSRQFALDRIEDEQPAWLPKKLVRTFGLLFTPDSFLFKKISRGAYGDLPLGLAWALLAAAMGTYLIVAVAGSLGMAAAPRREPALLSVMIAAGVFLLHVVAFTSSRHRLPIVALMMPYAAYALRHPGDTLRGLRGRRCVAPDLFIALLVGFCIPYFWKDAVALWNAGTYADPWRP